MSETSKIFGHFNVRILRKGEKYGLEDCLTHKERKLLVEFYDYRYRDDKEWKRGQFVSRYYAETLLKHDLNFGLSLDGGVPEWTVSAESMREILAWLRQELRADELPKLSDQLAENNLSQYALQIEANRLCNQYARALIRAMHSEYNGVCWLGKLNPDFGAQRPDCKNIRTAWSITLPAIWFFRNLILKSTGCFGNIAPLRKKFI